jgi:hypothetical protein
MMGVGTFVGTCSHLMLSKMLCLFPVVDDIDDGFSVCCLGNERFGFGSGLVNFMTVVCLPDLFPFLDDIEDGTIDDIARVVSASSPLIPSPFDECTVIAFALICNCKSLRLS